MKTRSTSGINIIRYKTILAQDKSEIQYLKEVFKLSEGESNFLITCFKGEGLLKVGADSAIIQIQPTAKEFEFVETNLNKLAQMKSKKEDKKYIKGELI